MINTADQERESSLLSQLSLLLSGPSTETIPFCAFSRILPSACCASDSVLAATTRQIFTEYSCLSQFRTEIPPLREAVTFNGWFGNVTVSSLRTCAGLSSEYIFNWS